MELVLKGLKQMRRVVQPLLRKFAGVPQTLLEEMPNCPALFKAYRNLITTGHKRVPGGWIYEEEYYPDYLTLGCASVAIHRTAQKYCKGHGLDIGAGYWPLPGSTPIDTEQGPGIANKLENIPENSQDYVFSSHCLEHISDWEKALDTWISKIKPRGVLFLYLPHPICKLWHISNPVMATTHKWVPTPEVIDQFLKSKGLEIIDEDKGPDHFYSFFVCARKSDRPVPKIKDAK
jgi:SAM-dependent methyltransferase